MELGGPMTEKKICTFVEHAALIVAEVDSCSVCKRTLMLAPRRCPHGILMSCVAGCEHCNAAIGIRSGTPNKNIASVAPVDDGLTETASETVEETTDDTSDTCDNIASDTSEEDPYEEAGEGFE
jgi:hypothetical protein